MIISVAKKFIFVHNPKTGGKSIREVLGQYHDVGSRWHKHISIFKARKVMAKKGIDISNFFIFGFVRNPWDRVASFYHFILDSKGNELRKFRGATKAAADVNEFARNVKKKSWQQRAAGFWKQTNYFDDGVFVCYYERYDEYIDFISKMIDIPLDVPHINKSSNTDYISQFNDEGKQLVEWRFKDDIERFGYTFDSYPIRNIPDPKFLKLCGSKKILIIGNAEADLSDVPLDDYIVVRINRYHGIDKCDIWCVNNSLLRTHIPEWENKDFKYLITAEAVRGFLRRRRSHLVDKMHGWTTLKSELGAAIGYPEGSGERPQRPSCGLRTIYTFLGANVTIAGFDFLRTQTGYSRRSKKHNFRWEREHVKELMKTRQLTVLPGTCKF